MNPELAINYVREFGDRLAQARLAYLLFQDTPPPEVLAILLAGQRTDGGWPPVWAANYSSLDATCYRFAQAHQLGINASDVRIARGCGFLAQRQKKNGSWEEARAQALAAPEWVKPGRRAAHLYLTANCSFWLSIFEGGHSQVSKAARFLLLHLGTDEGLPSFLQTQWLTGALFYRLNWMTAAMRLLTFLANRIDELPASSLAWMLLSFVIAGLPTDHSLIGAGVVRLEQQQLTNGAWPGDGKINGDIHTTLEVMAVLRFCGHL